MKGANSGIWEVTAWLLADDRKVVSGARHKDPLENSRRSSN